MVFLAEQYGDVVKFSFNANREKKEDWYGIIHLNLNCYQKEILFASIDILEI